MLILDGEIVQRLILQHRQIDGNIRSCFGTKLEVNRIHSRTHTKGLLVCHVSRTDGVASRIARGLLRTQIVGRRRINGQVLELK